MTTTAADPRTLVEEFWADLVPDARAAVRAIARAGGRSGGVYAVGGAVRDMLLGRPLLDIDLTTEGDAIAIARSALPEHKMVAHARFRTASLSVGGAHIDVATARRETYARPGALPRVEPADITADLWRRDFSVNAMALRLDGAPAFLDPCDGREDLEGRRIRVLHDRSFVDDATRIFRALRYAARLGFELEPRTGELLRRDLRYVETISGTRVRRELELMLLEPAAGAAFEAALSCGALPAIHPALRWSVERSRAYQERPGGVAALPYGFALLAADASADDAAAIVARLRLRRDEAPAIVGVAAMRGAGGMLGRTGVTPSGIAMLLDRYPPAAVAAFGATADGAIARALALRYLAEWRGVRPRLNGRDVIEMGVPEGPQVQRALQLIRAARLDGRAKDVEDERALAARFIQAVRDSTGHDSRDGDAPR